MKKKNILLIFLVGILMCLCLTACNTKSNKSPLDLIKKQYNTQEFNISFSSKDLDEPIADIKYTAKNIPKLPIPKRVGYVFNGWFLDDKYTIPYMDRVLYLYMSDVTLYPKWTKESFKTNGTYDIEFKARIVETSIKKGEKTDKYGGYKDFSASIIKSETYIESSNGRIMLKLQYNSGTTIPFGEGLPVYNVNVSSSMPTSVRITNRIDALNDTVKTLFIDITDMDLSSTLYLDIQTANWENDEIKSNNERIETVTRYLVAFDITNIIGFSQMYINPDYVLEKGYYLAKTYYSAIDGRENMGSSFNPVYSYIYSDGENYSLIKQNIPYTGLVTATASNLTPHYLYYFYRAMTFMPIQLFYEINRTDFDKNKNYEYKPKDLHAGGYGEYTVEFHADKGKAYDIYKIGNDLKKEFLVVSAVTGYMEVMNSMGTYEQVLTIDYDHIIKLADCDYAPLEGDAYVIEKPMQYYPGKTDDIDKGGRLHDNIMKNGLTTDIVNYYYSAESTETTPINRTVYNSKITISPTSATKANAIADSRYRIAEFKVNSQVYGYNPAKTKEKLFADTLTIQTFGSNAMREWKSAYTSVECKVNDSIKLAEEYAKNVDSNGDFSNIEYTAYALSNGAPDYKKPIELASPTFDFKEDIAVIFQNKENGFLKTSLILFTKKEEPIIEINNNQHGDNNAFVEGDIIEIPDVHYTWKGATGKFLDYYYSDKDKGANLIKVAVAYYDGSTWSFNYLSREVKTITLKGEKTSIIFELNNDYGEKYLYRLDYNTQKAISYSIVDSKGSELIFGSLSYLSSGNRKAIKYQADTQNLTAYNAELLLSEKYKIVIQNNIGEYHLKKCSIVADSISETKEIEAGDFDVYNYVWGLIKDKNYAFVQLVYEHGADIITRTFTYNVSFNCGKTLNLFEYSTYFAGYEYSVPIVYLLDKEGNKLRGGNITPLGLYDGLVLNKNKYQYDIKFDKAGTYSFAYNVYFQGITLKYTQKIEVYDRYDDVFITYVTDKDHPFYDGTTSMTVKYSLADNIKFLSKQLCAPSAPHVLFSWATTPERKSDTTYYAGDVISNYVNLFNAKHVTLYAVWDQGIAITFKAEGQMDVIQKYYLQKTSYGGRYRVTLPDYTANAPSGKYFIGWTGGFIGNNIVTPDPLGVYLSNQIDYNDENYFIINAVYKNKLTVRYDIDGNFSDDFFRKEQVLEGQTVSSPIFKMNVKCKVDGYLFAGWYVESDEKQEVVDLETYKITQDTTLVAKFISAEGKNNG